MEPISFREARLEGGCLVIPIPRESLGSVMAWIRRKKDRVYDLTIKEHRQKRSLDANAYAWVLIDKLATAMRVTKLEVYQEAIRSISGNADYLCIQEEALTQFKKGWECRGDGWMVEDMGPSTVAAGCRTVRAYYGSSVYDTWQMSLLIDCLVQDCKALDIETLPPWRLQGMVESWNGGKNQET